MATIYDLIEVTEISANTTYSSDNGNLLGVVDGMSGSSLDDGEFDWNDDVVIDGVTYNIDEIQKSTTAGSFTEADGTNHIFYSSGETNPDAVFLVLSDISDPTNVRYFIIPNDKYADMNVETIQTGGIGNVGFGDTKIISTVDDNVNTVCFARGTLIEIANNRQVPVEDLEQGDWVMTADHGMNEIKWIGASKIGEQTLAQHPNLRPIRIKKGRWGVPCLRRICMFPRNTGFWCVQKLHSGCLMNQRFWSWQNTCSSWKASTSWMMPKMLSITISCSTITKSLLQMALPARACIWARRRSNQLIQKQNGKSFRFFRRFLNGAMVCGRAEPSFRGVMAARWRLGTKRTTSG